MSEEAEQKGELFSRLYVDRGAPGREMKTSFRVRLSEEFEMMMKIEDGRDQGLELYIERYMRREGGKDIPLPYFNRGAVVADYLRKCSTDDLLDSVTLVYKAMRILGKFKGCTRWLHFVKRALLEENMAYKLDEECGVHFFVDEEFEQNRISALRCLSDARYAEVARNFEEAHGHLERRPPETTASVRSAFLALESMARLTTGTGSNLSRKMLKDEIGPLLVKNVSDTTERETIIKTVEGLAEIVNALHPYRHGQPVEQPVVLSFTFAVFVLSNAASFLRWLAEVDTARRA